MMPLCPGVGENVENVISSILIHLLLHTGHQTQGHLSRHRSAAILDIFKIRNVRKISGVIYGLSGVSVDTPGVSIFQKQVTLVTKSGDVKLLQQSGVLTESRIVNILDTPRILSRCHH